MHLLFFVCLFVVNNEMYLEPKKAICDLAAFNDMVVHGNPHPKPLKKVLQQTITVSHSSGDSETII